MTDFRNSGYQRVENDFYQTPVWCVERLFDSDPYLRDLKNVKYVEEEPNALIFDPCAGHGNLLVCPVQRQYDLIYLRQDLVNRKQKSESLHPRSFSLYEADFLRSDYEIFNLKKNHSSFNVAVLCNPPYSRGMPERFLQKSIEYVIDFRRKNFYRIGEFNARLYFILDIGYSCGVTRNYLFDKFEVDNQIVSFAAKYELTKRPNWIEGTKGGGKHDSAWYCWEFGNREEPVVWQTI